MLRGLIPRLAALLPADHAADQDRDARWLLGVRSMDLTRFRV